MDISPDGAHLVIANPDNGTVTVVDTVARKSLREIPLGEKPEGVTWIGSGPLAAVTVYHDNCVAIIDTVAGKIVKKLSVAHEPYGIAAAKDGRRAWVTHEYPGSVSEIDLVSQQVVREMKAGAFLRGIALNSDESRIYVTEFYTGTLRALDLNTGTVVDSWAGHSTDNLCRNVVVHPRRPKAYLSHLRSKIEIVHGGGSIFPQLSVCDLVDAVGAKDKNDRPNRRISFAMDTYNGVYVVANPW